MKHPPDLGRESYSVTERQRVSASNPPPVGVRTAKRSTPRTGVHQVHPHPQIPLCSLFPCVDECFAPSTQARFRGPELAERIDVYLVARHDTLAVGRDVREGIGQR